MRDLLPAVLSELNVAIPGSAVASATLIFSHLAQLCLRGLASEYWVVQKAEEIITNTGCPSEIIALPLGQLRGLTNEWGAGWGRTGNCRGSKAAPPTRKARRPRRTGGSRAVTSARDTGVRAGRPPRSPALWT